ncbi:MAG: AAA family ATPase [Planctomycetes bacterium]|nr:AAA family ATPase [Planctomycetota bacterium]
MLRIIIGYDSVVEDVLVCFFAGGNLLLESTPGLGKTLIVKTLAEVLDLPFKRIQFTPDLMPSDILGTTIVLETDRGEKVFEFQRGPVFTQILLADEINRATPKTQSALLEAMQERMVSVGGQTYPLDLPYFVLATQNPLDAEGTYSLPEAQIDRFFFKLALRYPDLDHLQRIGEASSGRREVQLRKLLGAREALELQDLVRRVDAGPEANAFAIRIILKTHPASPEGGPNARRFLRYGSSPRGVQALILGGKVRALVAGKAHVEPRHIAAVARQILNHRLILNFEGESEQMRPETLVDEAVGELMGSSPG